LNESSGLSRRGLLTGAGALLAGAGLAGCENATTPVPVAGGSGGKGIMGDPTAGGPVDASGIPLVRRDYPVTLPKLGDPVKTGKPERGGELRIYNYADYLNPAVIKAFGKQEGVSVRVTRRTRGTRSGGRSASAGASASSTTRARRSGWRCCGAG
jgi:spermidine/putrescine-binding protein